jgi:two-component system, NarL family, nitrate/nitrite response regulator NarL
MIKIFIIEDHPVTIAGLRNFFRPSRDTIIITKTADNINDALMIEDPGSFDVILLDLFLPSGNPNENYVKIAERYPAKPIVIYTGENSIYWQRQMYKLGCKGFLNKNSDKCTIEDTLRRVISGEIVYSTEIKEYQTKRSILGYKDSRYSLTIDQQEIIKLFIEGMPAKEIAARMGKSTSSINKSLQKIKEKFEVTNDIDLIITILKHQSSESLDSN